MLKIIALFVVNIASILCVFSAYAVPPVTGEPIIVQHLGKLEWPQDDPVTVPYLTQLAANDINDLHGDVTCDLIISTPGNYHMALRDAMKGRPDLGHVGLQQQVGSLSVAVCWSTSPPISLDQIPAMNVQFKNIQLKGLPALAMAPGAVMDDLVAGNLVDPLSRQPFLRNRGNVILKRAAMGPMINDICDLSGNIRVVTPNPDLEPGSFGNFSGTIFNVANQNNFGCNATTLFNDIFSQNAASFNTSAFSNPYNVAAVLGVFNKGSASPHWVASSRIMHRDIPYALCHNEADAAVIFYHLAVYMKQQLAAGGCALQILPLGGTESAPMPLPGNPVGTLFIAKVNGSFSQDVLDARDIIYNFLTASPIWTQIMADHGMDDPTP